MYNSFVGQVAGWRGEVSTAMPAAREELKRATAHLCALYAKEHPALERQHNAEVPQ